MRSDMKKYMVIIEEEEAMLEVLTETVADAGAVDSLN